MENMGAVSTSGGAGSLLPSRGGSAGSASLISKAGKPRTYDRSTGETQAELLRLVKRLNRALGLPPGRATDGVATASAQMLSKMVSRYEVTRVSVQQTQRTIEQKSKDYDTFRGAYGDLKGDPCDDDPLLLLFLPLPIWWQTLSQKQKQKQQQKQRVSMSS